MKLTATTFDPRTLERLDEHPRIAEATRALVDAERRLETADATHARATAELSAAEDDAAMGNRDDKRLLRIRQTLHDAESERRIHQRSIGLNRDRLSAVTADVKRDVFNNLKPRRDDALREMAAHLERARECSQRAAVLEDSIQRLLPSGMYSRGAAAFAIEILSWRREFGTDANSEANSRFALWKECCGLFSERRSAPSRPVTAVRLLKPVSLPRGDGHGCGGYNAGETAGFDHALAKRLIAQGFAVAVEQ